MRSPTWGIPPRVAEEILAYLDRYYYASREHAVMALIWQIG